MPIFQEEHQHSNGEVVLDPPEKIQTRAAHKRKLRWGPPVGAQSACSATTEADGPQKRARRQRWGPPASSLSQQGSTSSSTGCTTASIDDKQQPNLLHHARSTSSSLLDNEPQQQAGAHPSCQSRTTTPGRNIDIRGSMWPPEFESNGASYIYDDRSQMFYEPSSDFFYDTKSRLYYSNKKQGYFRYDDSSSSSANQSRFIPLFTSRTSKDDSDDDDEAYIKATKTSININIKSTEAPIGRSSRRSTVPGISNKVLRRMRRKQRKQERVALNKGKSFCSFAARSRRAINQPGKITSTNSHQVLSSLLDRARGASVSAERTMIGQPQRELQQNQEKQLDSLLKEASMLGHSTKGPNPPTPKAGGGRVNATGYGQPICILCKRKFASLEMLRRHEQHSELHRTNVMTERVDPGPWVHNPK